MTKEQELKGLKELYKDNEDALKLIEEAKDDKNLGELEMVLGQWYGLTKTDLSSIENSK